MLKTLIQQTLPYTSGTPSELGIQTPISDLLVFHANQDLHNISQLQQNGVCFILKGSKDVRIGHQSYQYQAGEFACYTVDLPIMTEYHTENGDYLDIRLFIDLDLMREMIDELHTQHFQFSEPFSHKQASKMSPDLIRAFELLMGLTANMQNLPVLLPLAKKAIYYYLLTSEQGGTLRQIALQNSNSQRIAQAVEWIKAHYNEPFNVEALAHQIGMSISGFYAHFRQLTGISPVQYQKNLRLTKAQSLLKSGNASVTEAASAIGYDSLSQFSREYKRYFGHPPRNDLPAVKIA